MIADSLLAIILSINLNPADYRSGAVDKKPTQVNEEEQFNVVANFLREHFTEVVSNFDEKTITVDFDGTLATIDWYTKSIDCEEEPLTLRLQELVRLATNAINPISLPPKVNPEKTKLLF
eukprot:TRINITY_DN5985_c0_g1_i1.p1 TRINITY_DN5985_c0_g1~~TRINITY_DN5985_c0_g1_i1.p1  ORF type:complete len:120 (-),score=37.07 TRINITY_DN5985_c0_g1_i1:83-442(-)